MGKFKTPEQLKQAILDYVNDPPMRTLHVAGDSFEVPNMTTQALAMHLGYASRQSLYDLANMGEEWKEVVDIFKSHMKSHYELHLQHGKGSNAQFMLSVLGEKAVSGLELTGNNGGAMENKWQVEFINAETKD